MVSYAILLINARSLRKTSVRERRKWCKWIWEEKNKTFNKRDFKRRQFYKRKCGKTYIVGDLFTNIDSMSCSSKCDSDGDKKRTRLLWDSLLHHLHHHHPIYTYASWPRVNARYKMMMMIVVIAILMRSFVYHYMMN